MTDDLTASMIYIRHKIVFVGDPATGKTSLMKRIVDNEFNPDYDATIGVDFFTKVVSYRENVFKLQLWDSAGQEKYKSLIPSYVKGASIIFVVFDVSKEDTYTNVDKWIKFINENIDATMTKIIIIGNKKDLERVVKTQKAMSNAKKNNIEYFETSAKSGDGVNTMFYSAISMLNFFDDLRKNDNNIINELIDTNVKNVDKSYKNPTEKNSMFDPMAYTSKINIKDSSNIVSNNANVEEKQKENKKCNC